MDDLLNSFDLHEISVGVFEFQEFEFSIKI